MRHAKFLNFINCPHSRFRVSAPCPCFPLMVLFFCPYFIYYLEIIAECFSTMKRCVGIFLLNSNIFHIKGGPFEPTQNDRMCVCVCLYCTQIPHNDYVLSRLSGVGKLSLHERSLIHVFKLLGFPAIGETK